MVNQSIGIATYKRSHWYSFNSLLEIVLISLYSVSTQWISHKHGQFFSLIIALQTRSTFKQWVLQGCTPGSVLNIINLPTCLVETTPPPANEGRGLHCFAGCATNHRVPDCDSVILWDVAENIPASAQVVPWMFTRNRNEVSSFTALQSPTSHFIRSKT